MADYDKRLSNVFGPGNKHVRGLCHSLTVVVVKPHDYSNSTALTH